MSTVTTAPNTAKVVSTETHKPEFGNGRYSSLMKEIWRDAQTIFRITSEAAEKLARQVASDIGAAMANAPVNVKLGRINDNGQLTISEACKMKGVVMTNAIFCLKALQYAGEAGNHGFSFGNTQWKPTEQLQQYLLSL